MDGRFKPGDHLRVRRPRGYNHHGIYVSDDRVIQFGGGITLTAKSRTGINAVPLNDFENGGTAKVVRHGTPRWITGYDPPADEAWKIVERAEFLLKLQPRLPYHLIGHNCEHIANMCVAGTWIESYQVRTFFGVRALGSFAFLVWQGSRSRANLPVPQWAKWAVAVWAISGLASVFAYNQQIKKFWDEIGIDWQKHERKLTKHPRNKQPGEADGTLRLSVGGDAPGGTSGAHQREICPEALRTAEISGAGQTTYRVHPPRSGTHRHKTRPTGRLIPLHVPDVQFTNQLGCWVRP